MRKLTKREKLIIKTLKELSNQWPDTLMLFSDSGRLRVVDARDGEILDELSIPNDGGDPEGWTAEDGTEYIDQRW